MLLHRLRRGGTQGTKELQTRIQMFDRGDWHLLLDSARATVAPHRRIIDPDNEWEQRLRKAELLVARGELSNAARLL